MEVGAYVLNTVLPGADLGGMTRVTSHPPPGAAAYFMLLLCVKAIYTFLTMPTSARPNSQTLKFHSPVSPDPLNASLAQVPKVTPRKKS